MLLSFHCGCFEYGNQHRSACASKRRKCESVFVGLRAQPPPPNSAVCYPHAFDLPSRIHTILLLAAGYRSHVRNICGVAAVRMRYSCRPVTLYRGQRSGRSGYGSNGDRKIMFPLELMHRNNSHIDTLRRYQTNPAAVVSSVRCSCTSEKSRLSLLSVRLYLRRTSP